jgi:hypothetical protein
VICKQKIGTVIQGLPLGNCLGQVTDEILIDYKTPDVQIKKFCSIGPKSYAYILSNGDEEVKSKGIPKLDGRLNYEVYKEMVLAEVDENKDKPIVTYTVTIPLAFIRNKRTADLERVSYEKTVQLTYDKRIILDNFRTRPYGTKDV